ncbi:Peptidase S8/S53 domain - like 10 [Theobroma cacao]|nr:Peptidase S8/S53 domain - like 10 [Theobroma cacao]
MAKKGLIPLLCSLLFAAFLLNSHAANASERKIHVVYMGDRLKGALSAKRVHYSMLTSILGSSSSAKESLVYSYGNFNAFAAKLTEEEVKTFSEMDGVVRVIPNHILQLHTTRSWDFLGFSQSSLGARIEGDVVIGLLDTGIWPEHESFTNQELGAPPSKWKGICQGANFTCNNKIVGARYYNSEEWYSDTDFKSPRDSEGHGTHTSSTAAGNRVADASYYGLANGIARGGVPGARIAMYKVCWSFGCATADILAAFDDAIADGVDIISVSLGFIFALAYDEDPIAIGAFHAMKNGILTSNSAGNSGPWPYSVVNIAPWTLTVAASTIDRKFVTRVELGNGMSYAGPSINSFDLHGKSYPLIWGGDAANYSAGSNPDLSKYCINGYLNSYRVYGNIVFCELLWDGTGILEASGVGTIMASDRLKDFAFSFPLPATVISTKDGEQILDYIRSAEYPVATILFGETWSDVMAPYVVSFSSRGPNPMNPDILKPDLTAPGVDIIAAWSPVAPPSVAYEDPRSVNYNIISGTSMSCPHASGAAAYVKAAHPDWSPAAVKSALMTTATVMDSTKHEDLEFAYGSGQINPAHAIEPGLVYDANETDYINFLCKQGYNTTTIRLITGDNSSVCTSTVIGRAWDLNYPSFSLAVEDGEPISGVFTRTVTNVGSANSTYTVRMYSPSNFSISVEPQVLSFSTVGEKKSYTVTVTGGTISQQKIMSGAIIWTDGDHQYEVRSPVVVYNVLPGYTYFPPQNSKFQEKPTFQGPSMYEKYGVLGRN